MISIFNWFVKITGYLVQLVTFRTRVTYEDATVQKRRIHGPAIVIANHTGIMDYALLLYLFFTRTLRCQVAELQFDRFFMRNLLRMLGAIRVDRSFQDMSCMAKSEAILRKGGVVVIFPEGRLPRKGEETLLPFKTGAAYLALNAQVPVIPVYTDGNYFCKKRCNAVIGKPIDVSELYDGNQSERENLQKITDTFRQKIAALGELTKKERLQSRFAQVCWYILYDFIKLTAAIPVFIWLRPKWMNTGKKRHIIRGSALIVGNHNSFYDPIALMLSVLYRRFRFVAAKELFEGRLKGWLFGKVFRCISIDRQNLGMQTFREVNLALQNREVVAIFPEGHVLTGEQTGMGTMHSGMVLMAYQGNSPIIPIYIQTPKKWYHRLRIAIGETIEIERKGMMPTMEEINRITGEVTQRMNALREICFRDSGRNE